MSFDLRCRNTGNGFVPFLSYVQTDSQRLHSNFFRGFNFKLALMKVGNFSFLTNCNNNLGTNDCGKSYGYH